MSQDEREAEALAVRMLGEKEAALMKEKARKRIHGLLTAPGRAREWEKALDHISLHFLKQVAGKPSHTRFIRKYCDKEAVRELIKQATSAPSHMKWVMLNIAGEPRGGPGIKIVRLFRGPIGEGHDLNCLVVITDHLGTLVTAYPGTMKDLS
jgi:hypothetical protein